MTKFLSGWESRCASSSVLRFVDVSLRGIGQVMFQDNPLERGAVPRRRCLGPCFPRSAFRYRAVHPPSTGSATPLSCAASSEQRNTASAPSCSGVVDSSQGCFSPSSLIFASSCDNFSLAARASICFCTSGVSTQPGHIALQVTPAVAVSSATALVRPTTPCLEAT